MKNRCKPTVIGVADFAERHNLSAARVRALIREERVFPYQQLGNGRYVLFPNTVIVAPYERPGRKMRRAA